RALSALFCAPAPLPTCSPLSLHDALPISVDLAGFGSEVPARPGGRFVREADDPGGTGRRRPARAGAAQAGSSGIRRRPARRPRRDRKSTRLSSHVKISYAVFCLKKKNQTE